MSYEHFSFYVCSGILICNANFTRRRLNLARTPSPPIVIHIPAGRGGRERDHGALLAANRTSTVTAVYERYAWCKRGTYGRTVLPAHMTRGGRINESVAGAPVGT